MKILTTLLLLGMFGLSPKPVSINLNPHVGFAPLEVKGYVVIEPNEKNRSACLVFNSENFLSQSCKELDGKDQLKSNPVDQLLPISGHYDISVVLYQSDGKSIQSNIEHIEVVGRGDDIQHDHESVRPDTTLHVSNR